MKRSKHSLSHTVLSTFDMGQLVPVANFAVLPGDSIRMQTSALIRCSPLQTPVMHPVVVRLHAWYCPYRLIWPEPQGWEDFITGGLDGVFGGTYPANTLSQSAGGLADYFGIPPGIAGVSFSMLPFRAYNRIYNENYRDEDLITEVSDSSGVVQRVAWEKDRFTAARPWTQKGPAVSMPLGTVAPVKMDPSDLVTSSATGLRIRKQDGSNVPATTQLSTGVGGAATSAATIGTNAAGANTGAWYPSNLYADLAAATAAQVNDLRRAMALQRYQEARAQYGHRFTEYLRYLGIRSSDSRLNRPEYLGGGKATISFSEVLRTATTAADTSPVGDMSGHGIAAVRTRPFVRFFEEHGHVMVLASVRPRSMYVSGLDREWSKRTKEDYWQKELELIGQQDVKNKEVYMAHATPDGVFGYQDRYSEYRHLQSYVCGDFRSTLNDWHLGRIFGAAPSLNQAFVECDPGVRPFADQTGADKLWCMFAHSIQARRLVGKRTIGRIM